MTRSGTITLPLRDRRQIETAIETLIDILDYQDREPQFVVTDAGRQALELRS